MFPSTCYFRFRVSCPRAMFSYFMGKLACSCLCLCWVPAVNGMLSTQQRCFHDGHPSVSGKLIYRNVWSLLIHRVFARQDRSSDPPGNRRRSTHVTTRSEARHWLGAEPLVWMVHILGATCVCVHWAVRLNAEFIATFTNNVRIIETGHNLYFLLLGAMLQ